VSSVPSEEMTANPANNVVYIGRASFRFEHGAEEIAEQAAEAGAVQLAAPGVTARIARWVPAEQEDDDTDDRGDTPAWPQPDDGRPRWVALPLWTLACLGVVAFVVGLAVSAAIGPSVMRVLRPAPPAAVGEAQPQAARALSTIVVEPIARR